MKHIFTIIIFLLFAFTAKAQTAKDSITYYPTCEKAVEGLRKTEVRYRGKNNRKHLVVYNEKTLSTYYVDYQKENGYFLVLLDSGVTVSAD